MTCGRFPGPDVWRVTVAAGVSLLVLRKLFFNRYGFGVGDLLVVLVTRGAGGDRHIGRESAQRRRTGDVDVATGAFHHVLALTTLMIELCRDAFAARRGQISIRRFMTATTVAARRLLISPVTIKARVVAVRHGLGETARRRNIGLGRY